MALPAAPLLTRKKVVGAAAETTKGTSVLASVTTALASTLTYDAKCSPQGMVDDGRREPDGLYQGQIVAVPGKRVGQLTFRQELRHGDVLMTLLTACGYKDATGYKPVSSISDQKCLSMKVWEDGRMKAIIGAMGDCSIEWTHGGRVFANWTFTGVWQAPTDVAMPATAPVTSVTTLKAAGATLTVGGAAIGYVGSGRINLGNSVAMREDITSASGVIHAVIESRNPTVELDPEAATVANSDCYGSLLAGTAGALALVFTDGTATLTVGALKLQYTDIADSARGGRLVDAATFLCAASSGDDELSFAYSV